jgi:hypothetical protein
MSITSHHIEVLLVSSMSTQSSSILVIKTQKLQDLSIYTRLIAREIKTNFGKVFSGDTQFQRTDNRVACMQQVTLVLFMFQHITLSREQFRQMLKQTKKLQN